MGKIILITGGGRSGKSGHALKLGESLSGPRVFVATCPVLDDEMRDRIKKHRQERRKGVWRTIEEETDLIAALRRAKTARVVLVDCLTLWINNLLYAAEKSRKKITERTIARQSRELITAAKKHSGTIIFVTNEIGMGIIPETPICRLYRDLAGRCNQVIATGSDSVVLMVAGQPLQIKPPIHDRYTIAP